MQQSQNLKPLWKHGNAVLLCLKETGAWPNGSLSDRKKCWTISFFLKLRSNRRRNSWLKARIFGMCCSYSLNIQKNKHILMNILKRLGKLKQFCTVILNNIYWRKIIWFFWFSEMAASVISYLMQRDFLLLEEAPVNH